MNNFNDSTPFIPLYKKTYYIHKTIIKNDMESLKHILSDGRRDTINDLDYSGRTPFHVALQQANPKALYLMLYYPLLHPSKLFATMDWKDTLDSVSKKSKHLSNRLVGNQHQVTNKDTTEKNLVKDRKQNKLNKLGSSDPSYLNNLTSVERELLTRWEKNPEEYFNSCLSLDEKSQMNGCGVREVENLYEEHYKFLVGESHNLENAAKTYTRKYLRLYYPSYFKTQPKEFTITTRSDSLNSMSLNTDVLTERKSDEKIEGAGPSSFEDNSMASNENATNNNVDNSLSKHGEGVDNLVSKIATQTVERLKKGLMEVGTVDLIATFDKTSPLHLLFSNVFISTYRPNMFKCFRILIYYFNKSDEFYEAYNSMDCTMYFNSHSINRSLDLYHIYRRYKRKMSRSEKKEESPKKSKTSDSLKSHHNGKSDSGTENVEEECEYSKRDVESELTNAKKPKNGSSNNSGAKLDNFPNLTVCADASEMAQKGDKRSYTLLNSHVTQSLGTQSDKYVLFEAHDKRPSALHSMIVGSLTWARPSVSWDTFIKRQDFSRSSILHRVCNLKDRNLIKIVLSCGFSPLVVNEAGDMPVHLSVDAKDANGFLTILNCTMKELFYSRFNPRNYDIEVFLEDVPTVDSKSDQCTSDPEERINNTLSNEFYNMYMGHMCHKFFKMRERVNDKFYKVIDHSKFKALLSMMDHETSKLLFDEFLMLFEQLVYRCIKSWSWECLIALLSYNAVVTYHLLSSPSFMHRFLNFSSMINNCDEFLSVVEFVLTNVLFESLDCREQLSTQRDKKYSSTRVRESDKDSYKGFGIPHMGLRSLTHPHRFKPVGRESLSVNEDLALSTFVRNYKSSTSSDKAPPKTWIITHPTCLHHLATPEPTDAPNKRHRLIVTYPENPTRLEVIISNDNGILRSDTLENVKLVHSPPPASLADILRVHDWAYIDKLLEQVQVAQKRWATHPYWPVLADGDTPVTPHSWSAALYAAGSGRNRRIYTTFLVISAVDAVCTKMCKNAFCAVRPPGHHLGTWGGAQSNNFEDEDFAAGSQGFCLINNVAIGAAYAKYTYANKGIQRIAIIDFDVHHGNGTEQVIRNIGPKNVKIQSNSSESCPESQPQPETVHKKWFGWRDENDRNDVLFASIHAYDGIFYPGTGQQCTMYQKENSANVINVAVPQGTSSAEFRALFETKICPYVYHFKPDLMFISAGFDGHYRDSVSYGFTRYTEKDFNYVTERLVTIANSVCEGRVVSVLEGGYNTKLNTLSPFARSVLEHVTALCNTKRDTSYPYMFGETSINYLLSSVIKRTSSTKEESHAAVAHNEEVLSSLNYRLNVLTANGDKSGNAPSLEPPKSNFGPRKKGSDSVFKAYKIRTKTELLISKVYSKPMCYCKHARLAKLDKTQMCCKSVMEICGNQFLSFYSRYFNSLFSVSSSMTTLPDFFVKTTGSTIHGPIPKNSEFGEIMGVVEVNCDLNRGSDPQINSHLDKEYDVKDSEITKSEHKLGTGDYSKKTSLSHVEVSQKVPTNFSNVNYDNVSKHLNEKGNVKRCSSAELELQKLNKEPSGNTTGSVTSRITGMSNTGNLNGNADNNDFITNDIINGNSNNYDNIINTCNTNKIYNTNNSYSSNLNTNYSDSKGSINTDSNNTNSSTNNENNANSTTVNPKASTGITTTAANADDGIVSEREKSVPMNPFDIPYEPPNSDEDIDNVVTRLKVIMDVNRSNNLTSTSPWLADVKLRALERNYQVALKLDGFYAKFGELFNKTCHIHQ